MNFARALKGSRVEPVLIEPCHASLAYLSGHSICALVVVLCFLSWIQLLILPYQEVITNPKRTQALDAKPNVNKGKPHDCRTSGKPGRGILVGKGIASAVRIDAAPGVVHLSRVQILE